eukprot:CAMPEP_0175550190 /NCGR_PEP_ID=MMETSP0096-20121207/31699_1 /TAXON_ID=311494 /ORGANISM="Alexandrium monilatum, Strain CCMP3105" /LENGTH=367 /DNA_ID=CAMNT_0016853235 /DNA_START=21 /DNA_END=1121 /DNA_ORIENTATION=-
MPQSSPREATACHASLEVKACTQSQGRSSVLAKSIDRSVQALVLNKVLWVDILRVEYHKLPVCAAALLAVSQYGVIVAFYDRLDQLFDSWRDLIRVLHLAAKNAAHQNRVHAVRIGLRVLVALRDGLRKVQAAAVQRAGVAACEAQLEVARAYLLGRCRARPVEEVPLVALRSQAVCLVAADALPGHGRLDVGDGLDGIPPLLRGLLRLRQQLRAPHAVLLPVVAVLVAEDRHDLEAAGDLLVLVVSRAVARPSLLVRHVEQFLEVLETHGLHVNQRRGALAVVVPIVRVRDLAHACLRHVAAAFVLAALAVAPIAYEVLAWTVANAARPSHGALAGRPQDHLLDAERQAEPRSGPAGKLVKVDHSV